MPEERLSPAPCCVPSLERARLLEISRAQSASLERIRSGSTEDMVLVESARFLMGTDYPHGFPDDGEGPIRPVDLHSFYIDKYPVTNTRFQEFIRDANYITEAERFGWSFVFAGHLPNLDGHPVAGDGLSWWRRVDGARWNHPEGPDSNIDSRPHHPVVHISWNDAAAYAAWAGKRLPTEAEWEFAARGGLEQKLYPWGDELTPEGRHLCNIWQGEFPLRNTAEDGYGGVAPVDAFPANGFRLFSVAGNTWEWCSDWFSPHFHQVATRSNPVGPPAGNAKVMRGGSYLCHASYCNRYRVAARTANTPDSSTTNVGFRCVRDI